MHGEHVLGLYDIGGHEKVRMRYPPVHYHIAGDFLCQDWKILQRKRQDSVSCAVLPFLCRFLERMICAFSGDGGLVDAVDGGLQNLVELGVALACAKILGEGA